jgi:hypothetical protein
MIYEYRNTMERHDQATTTNHVRITPPPPPLVEIRVEVMAKVAPLLVVFCIASISVMSRCSSVCDDKKNWI